MAEEQNDYLGVLDGVRGLMALWVFFGHLLMAVTGNLPRFGSPAYAVDVFMFLSGFLMMYHWRLREKRFETRGRQTIDFYVRRFFRIAPIYYLLFFVAIAGHDYLSSAREYINSAVPPPWAAEQATVVDHKASPISLASIAAHLTFLFGFIPRFAADNSLPDWSIGLEMQFYLFLPLLVLVLDRVGPLSLAIGSLALAYVTGKLFGLYLTAGPLGTFPQPSFIAFKLYTFVAGMCIAEALLKNGSAKLRWLIPGTIALAATGTPALVCIGVMVLLLFFDNGSTRKEILHRALAGPIGKFLGDTSYSTYLLHMLLVIPIVYFLLLQPWFLQLPGYARMAIALPLVGVPLYLMGYALHRTVELRGIAVGRTVIQRIARTWGSQSTTSDQAPQKAA